MTNRIMIRAGALTLAVALMTGLPPVPSFAAIEEIVVTAQRREQSLQDVPIAVSAFTEDELAERQIDEPLDIVQYIPNLFGNNNTGLGTANSYYLRGLGNTESIATFDPPVGTYVDNVYIARQNGNNVAFFDIDRIEVLRGPQGTLFGRNTTGGAVSVHMKKPAEERGGFLELGAGDFDRRLVRGSVDLPVSDTVLTKFSGFWINEDGYVDNRTTGDELNGEEGYGLRADVRLLPSDAITWDLSAEFIDSDNLNVVHGFRNLSVFQRPQDNGINDNTESRFSNTGIRASDNSDGSLEQLARGEGLGNSVESWAISSNLAWDTEFGTLEFITAYRSLDQNFIIDFFDGPGALGGFTIANQGEHTQFSQEIKFSNSYYDEKVNLVAGLFYFDEENTTDFSDIFALPFGNLLLADREQQNDVFSFALYAQGDIQLTDRLLLTVGARWTREEKDLDYVDFKPGIVANNPFTNVLAFPAAPGTELTTANIEAAGIDTSLNESIFTPRVAVQYQFTDNIMGFVSYTEGFKSGGWNARGTSALELLAFDPEMVTNYEVGIRSQFADDRVRLNITAFSLEAEDFQVPSAFVRPNGTVAFITRNFADLENEGLEIDLTWVPVEALSVYLAVGIQDAEQKPGAAIRSQIADCVAGVPGTAGVGIVDPNCEVADATRSPDLTISAGASYTIQVPRINGYVTGSLNYRYTDEMNVGTSGLANAAVDDTDEINAGVTVGFGENFRLTLECNNCNNELIQNSTLAGTSYYNEPRRFTFRARYDF